MIETRPISSLGRSDFGVLKAMHHIAVGSPLDNPVHGPIGALLVWNDDEIAAGAGVPLHPHANVEIITYVREGDVSHSDSMGNRRRLQAGDVQVMSAGTGLRHGEMSNSPTKIFQIWIRPREPGGEPRWGTRSFPGIDQAGGLVVLASGFKGDNDALPLRADARVVGARLRSGQAVSYELGADRFAYLVPSRGRVAVNGVPLDARDGVELRNEPELRIEAIDDAEIIFVDVV